MGKKERREKEREKRRQDILDAARSLLLKRGHHNISMRQIASIAELGVSTIYTYFPSKEDIFAALSREAFDLIHDTILAAAAGRDPARRMRRIGEALLLLSESHKSYYDFIDYFISTPEIIFPAELKAQVDTYGKRILDPISAVVRLGIESGRFRRIDPLECALMFIGSIHGLIHFRKMDETILRGRNFRALFARHIDCFITGISA
ncbi:MAG: TetR/AcrR family transcriptional regulator [Spirochaetes bacterium]|nr:TetR/AcrR family transcriptional regulator [Spirochaetota bacterium]